MKPIGGYLELELPPAARPWHRLALAFSTGRACLAAILAAKRPRAAHVPAWSCEGLYQPMRRAGVRLRWYRIGPTLAPAELPEVGRREILVLINAFGTLTSLAAELAARLGDRLVVDNSQAFYLRDVPGAWAFNSARKFFGVPDGAYLYAPRTVPAPAVANTRFTADHLVTRLAGDVEGGFPLFQRNEARLDDAAPGMSRLSERILAAIDYDRVAAARRDNFSLLHARLGYYNRLEADLDSVEVPMCYPFLPEWRLQREDLIARRIFVPRFWHNVLDRPEDELGWERELAACLLPLPIDQRYGPRDMERTARTVLEARF